MNNQQKVQIWKNLRPQRLIDREDVLQDILAHFQAGEKVYYLLGDGGIGKTRLLEAIRDGEFTKQDQVLLTVGIFDIYHPRYHTVSGIEKAIVGGIREALNNSSLFGNYEVARTQYDNARKKMGYPPSSLEELRERTSNAFWGDFKQVAESIGPTRSLLFLFDTMELLFHEEDPVERLLEARPPGLEIVDWLRKALQVNFAYNNVHFLLSGRPERNWYGALQGGTIGERRLGPLSPEGVEQYLLTLDKSLKKGGIAPLLPEDQEGRSEFIKSVQEWSRGRPLRLAFITMLMQQDKWPLQSPPDDEVVDLTLVKMIMDMIDPLGIVLPYVAFLRKGVTPGLLYQVLEEHRSDLGWEKEYIEGLCDELKAMPFVKVRPDDRRIFLHDEMYRVMSPILMALGTELREIANTVVQYYADKEDADKPVVRAEGLYYQATVGWRKAFDDYRYLSDEAIAEHRTGNDLLYRDEILRFVSDYKSPWAKDLDCDATIRWLKRLIAMGEYESAKKLTEKIREQGKLNLLTEGEQQVFSVYEAEAKIYTGDIDGGLEQLEKAEKILKALKIIDDIERRLKQLEETKEVLKTEVDIESVLKQLEETKEKLKTEDDIESVLEWLEQIKDTLRIREELEPTSYEEHQRVQAYIRAHNDIGYANARRREYWKAASAYKQALRGYRELAPRQDRWQDTIEKAQSTYGKGAFSDWADTLKNLAFVYSRLGYHRAARLLAVESDKLYKAVGNQYGHALTQSALGAIFAEREWYCNSRSVLEEALHAFQVDVPDERGEALASLGLGQALRKLVDMENVWEREQEIAQLLERSEKRLRRALNIFSEKERTRLPDVYQALGCLYRDKLAFQVRLAGDRAAEIETYRDTSIDSFGKALSEEDLQNSQKAEIYIDQAEVCYHYHYKEGYGEESALPSEGRKILEGRLKAAEDLVPHSYRYPYRLPYSPEEERDTLWWQVMGKIHLLKGHVAFKGGQFEEALEEYLESFLFFDLYSEEASLFSVASRSGRRLYSKFARIPEEELRMMEDFLLQKGDKRRILDRPGWRYLLSLVRDARMHAAPYVL